MLASVIIPSLLFIVLAAESRTTQHNVKNEETFSRDFRIVNGEETERHEFPSMAMITSAFMGRQVCGASVINKRFVLTAGHCIIGVPVENPPYIRLRLGAHNKTWQEDPHVQEFAIKRIIPHPDFKPVFIHDFALLELEKDAVLNDYVKPICLPPTDKDLTGKMATVAGWGKLSHGGKDSILLRKAEVAVVDQKECEKKFDGAAPILDDMICAGGKGKDACQKDSGGPLMWQDNNGTWRLIGIVSFGDDCGGYYYPGVYARVSSVVDWIKSVVGDEVC